MSKLDQAISKAYAKDRRAVASPAAIAGATGVAPVYGPSQGGPVTARPTAGARAIDQIYHEGVLYRVEGHPIGSARPKQIVPAPHLSMLPPTSPRRAVRRSMLRMLSANTATATAEAVVEAPPRVARKVIIRHISASAPPPPLGLLRASRGGGLEQGELPPETITDEPIPPAPAEPSPTTPQVVPQIAPLNIAVHAIQSFEIRGDWDHEAAVSPMVLVS